MTITAKTKKQILKLESDDINERTAAIKALSEKQNKEITQYLIDLLKENTSAQYRESACRIFAELKSKDTIDVLIDCLNDPNDGVKFYAVLALKNISDSKAVKPLLKNLRSKDNDSLFKSEMITALGDIGDEIAIDSLIGILRNDKDKYVRHNAARALGNMKNKKALNVLNEIAGKEKNSRLYYLALNAIDQITH